MTEGLPEGWASCSPLEVAALIRGVSYAKGEAASAPGKGRIGLLRANNIADDRLQFDDLQHVPETRASPQQRLVRGDVVIAMSSGSKKVVGKAASLMSEWNGTFGAFCGVLRPTSAIDARFFGLFFQTDLYRRGISDLSAGTNINNIKRSHFDEFRIPLPPLAEQKRIVEKVEALLAQVQAARDRLARVQQILKRFRQAVLAAASLGELTAPWRESRLGLQSGSEFLKEILTQRQGLATGPSGRSRGATPILEPAADDLPELPESWTWTTVDALSTKVVDGVHRTPAYQESGIPFVTVRNLTAGPGLDLRSLKYIRASDHREFIKRANPERGDLLISKDGTLGVVRAIRTDAVFSIFVSVALIKPVDRGMTDFLELALSSHPVQQRLVPTGSGLQHLHLRDLKASPVPLPPAAEQVEIVRRARELFSLADAIEARVRSAIARSAAAPQAILAKAFAGDLVPAEAELARTEGRGYESGEELLARVRAGLTVESEVTGPALRAGRRGRNRA